MIGHAFPSRGTGMCAQACSIGWLIGNLRSIMIGVCAMSARVKSLSQRGMIEVNIIGSRDLPGWET